MNTISGKIDSIYTKEVQIKNGPRAGSTSTVYHAMISGHDVNLGFKCDFEEGETVNLTVEEKYGGYQVVKGGANGAAAPAPAAATAAAAAPALKPAPAAFPTPKNTKEVSIVRQNAMRHAVPIVRDMIEAKVIGAPKTEAEYVEKVIEVAYSVFDFSSGWREQKMADAGSFAAYAGDE